MMRRDTSILQHITIQINEESIPAVITRKRIRNLYLRIQEDSTLTISAPLYMPKAQIEAFLKEKQVWIVKASHHARQKQAKESAGENGTVLWLGQAYPVKVIPAEREAVMINDGYFCFMTNDPSGSHLSEMYEKFARKQMKMYLEKERIQWDQRICDAHHLPHPAMTIRSMRSRWGSCTPARNHISMNVRLMHYPYECLQYVLLHEYVHLLVPGHPARFYQTVATYMPDWKAASDKLK
ncbi:M48 family metallopeptidase [Lactimicrobium sp.]|uniref:M48 family metallopeptidase n=2 Tax=Lactimicrobium sp. TaxID=2563780 RepID=UPI002F3598DB